MWNWEAEQYVEIQIPSDGAVVRQVLSGHSERFEVLVRRHLGAVRAVALARTGNPADADDVVQETFLAAYRALDSLREPKAFRGWLLTICRNTAFHWRKDLHRLDAVIRKLDPDPVLHPNPAREELHMLLREHLNALEPEWREILLLHYFSGYNAREIGDMLGLTHGAVRKRLQRARESLSDRMLATLRTKEDGDADVKAVMTGVAAIGLPWEGVPGASGGGGSWIVWGSLAATIAVIVGGSYWLIAPPGPVGPPDGMSSGDGTLESGLHVSDMRFPGAGSRTGGMDGVELSGAASGEADPMSDVASSPSAAEVPGREARVREGTRTGDRETEVPSIWDGATYWTVYQAEVSADGAFVAGTKIGVAELLPWREQMHWLGVEGDIASLVPYMVGTGKKRGELRLASPVAETHRKEYAEDAYERLKTAVLDGESRLNTDAAVELARYLVQYPEALDDIDTHADSTMAFERVSAALVLGLYNNFQRGVEASLDLEVPADVRRLTGWSTVKMLYPSSRSDETWILKRLEDPRGLKFREEQAMSTFLKQLAAGMDDLRRRGMDLPFTETQLAGWPKDTPYELVAYNREAPEFWPRVSRAYRDGIETDGGGVEATTAQLQAWEAYLDGVWGSAFPWGKTVLEIRDEDRVLHGFVEFRPTGEFSIHVVNDQASEGLGGSPAISQRTESECRANLSKMVGWLTEFADKQGGHYPGGWRTVYPTQSKFVALLTCPSHRDSGTVDYTVLAPGANREALLTAGAAFLEMADTPETRSAIAAAIPVVSEVSGIHDGGVHVAFMDGHAEFVPTGLYEDKVGRFLANLRY